MLSLALKKNTPISARAFSKHLKAFATVDPKTMAGNDRGFNLINGEWTQTEKYNNLIDPLSGGTLMKVPATSEEEIKPFIESMKAVPKSGLHNPFKNKKYMIEYNCTVSVTAALVLFFVGSGPFSTGIVRTSSILVDPTE